jgi:hypothetical protein
VNPVKGFFTGKDGKMLEKSKPEKEIRQKYMGKLVRKECDLGKGS